MSNLDPTPGEAHVNPHPPRRSHHPLRAELLDRRLELVFAKGSSSSERLHLSSSITYTAVLDVRRETVLHLLYLLRQRRQRFGTCRNR